MTTNETGIEARSFADDLQDSPLRFQPPELAGLSPDAAAFWWRQISYAFPINDPRSFPAIGRKPFSAEQLETLDRYLVAAGELAESEVLNGDHRVAVSLDGDSESVDASLPKTENLRGFSVLFRQFYSDSEVASFDRVRKTLGAVAAQLEDDLHDHRLEELKSWKKAHGRMKGKQLEMLVLEQMVKNQRIPPFALEQHREIPLQLISLYNYGELIHFGERREKLEEVIGAGPFEENWTKMEFMIAAAGLSHLYIGFGMLVQAALAD